MWVSFFESVKYTGHLFPISFLRIFMGVLYIQQGLEKLNGDFLSRPRLAEQISNWLPGSSAPAWYKYFIGSQIIPHWQTAAFIILGLELAIGISYILGYVVRPMALVAVFLCFNLIFFYGPASEELLKNFVAVHFVLAWVGAGRCLGFDYYFFKRRRGIWW
jgi:thiosulfate dehydrogenase [quinone] large subunit